MALRQTTGFVESLRRLLGLDWAVPDFSMLSRRQKTLKVNIPYRGSDGPLHLLVDSIGIKVEGEGGNVRTPVSMAARSAGSGARSTSGSTRNPWKSGRPSSPPTTWAMHRCCPSCWTRSRQIRRSQRSPPTAPSTPASAMTPSPLAARQRSFCPGRTPSHGSPTPPEPLHKTRSCEHQNLWVEPSGDDGADTTAEAGLRPKCTASSSWASASRRGTSIVRSLSSKSVLPCPTVSPRSESPSLKPWHKSVRGRGSSDHQPICATEPCFRVAFSRRTPNSSACRSTAASHGSLVSRSYPSQRVSVVKHMPRSPAISRRVRPLASASRTALRRNSGVGLFPFLIEHFLASQLVLCTFSGAVHSGSHGNSRVPRVSACMWTQPP